VPRLFKAAHRLRQFSVSDEFASLPRNVGDRIPCACRKIEYPNRWWNDGMTRGGGRRFLRWLKESLTQEGIFKAWGLFVRCLRWGLPIEEAARERAAFSLRAADIGSNEPTRLSLGELHPCRARFRFT